jgi:hypothetical protein
MKTNPGRDLGARKLKRKDKNREEIAIDSKWGSSRI